MTVMVPAGPRGVVSRGFRFVSFHFRGAGGTMRGARRLGAGSPQ